MVSCPDQQLLSRFLADELPPAERSTLETHVEECNLCQQVLERLTDDPALRWRAPANPAGQAALVGIRRVDFQVASDTGVGQDRSESSPSDLLRVLSPSSEPGSLGCLGDYEVLEMVGVGGMGAVFRAVDRRLQRVVALKMLMPHLAASGDAQRRFEREARTAAAVSHENVVAVYDVGQANGTPFLVMQHVAGVSLQERLRRGPPFAVNEVVRIGREVLAGLAAAHARGLVHRDIKPSNILMEAGSGRVKVSDFGLARAVDDASLTRSGVLAGTPLYMSPEQADGLAVDTRSDLFSLGSVLYALCTGQLPFEADSTPAILKRICEQNPVPIRTRNPAVPGWLEAVIMRLLAKQPAERFASAEEAADALSRQEPHLAVRPTRRWVAGLALVLVAGAVVVALGAWGVLRLGTETGARTIPGSLATGELVVNDPDREFGKKKRRPKAKPRLVRQHPPGDLPDAVHGPAGMALVRVPKGKFWMGGREGRPGTREVTIPYDFYLGKYEITQGEWQALAGQNPSFFSPTGDGKHEVKDLSGEEWKRLPVESINVHDMDRFLERLNQQEAQSGWQYCVPLSEEWEYACRGGPMTEPSESAFEFCLAKPTNILPANLAHYGHRTSLPRPRQVGSYPANPLGLHDMHGNVSEWCDADEPSPHGMPSPVYRGGSWEVTPIDCRADRFRTAPPHFRQNTLGVRVARVFVGKVR